MQVRKRTCLSQRVCQQLTQKNRCSILQKVIRAYLGRLKTAALCSIWTLNLAFEENQKLHSQKSDPWIHGVMKAMILPSALYLLAFLNCCMYQICVQPYHPETINHSLIHSLELIKNFKELNINKGRKTF